MDLVGEGVDSQGGYVSKILYVKTKELGPLGGGTRQARSPRSANDFKFSVVSHLARSYDYPTVKLLPNNFSVRLLIVVIFLKLLNFM